MKKAILPLLLIITMVLSASVASATSYTGSGTVTDGNGWKPSGEWIQNTIEYGLTTNTSASATHDVATAASGQFNYDVQFRVNSAGNTVTIGAANGDAGITLKYANGNFYLNDGLLGKITVGLQDDPHAKIWSDDGKTWFYDVDVYNGEYYVGKVPTSISIAATCADKANTPMIYSVSFTSEGEPAIEVLPVATSGASYDIKQVQDFYNNVYPLLYGQQGNIGMTPAPAATGATVSGTVTAAADGKAIAGASIVLDLAKQTTDSLGNYKFTGVSNGSAELAVSADGYAAQTMNVNVNGDLTKNIALVKAGAGSSVTANAANETANTTVTNTTVTNTTTATTNTTAPTAAPTTTAPSPTQTKSPGFEGIIAAIAMIGAAGVLVYVNRKH